MTACTVVISPSSIPQLSLITFATGARQLVVQEALETTVMSLVYFDSLTPMTNNGISSLGGAEIITFFAPPLKCALAVAFVVNWPVDSQM